MQGLTLRGVDFDETLAELAAMNGRRVTASVGAVDGEPPMTVVTSGVVRSGDELSGEAPSPSEAYYFTLGDGIVSGFFVHRTAFVRAEQDGGMLRILLGPLVLMVEPED